MKKRVNLLWVACLALGFLGCSDDDDNPSFEEIFAEQQTQIQNFVSGKQYTAIPFEGSVNGKTYLDSVYVLNYTSTGAKPEAGDFVLVDWDRMTLDGRYIYSTNVSIVNGENLYPMYEFGGPVFERILTDDKGKVLPYCAGLTLMGEGTTAEIAMTGYLSREVYSLLYIKYKLHKIVKDIAVYEDQLINSYLENGSYKEIIEVPASNTDTLSYLAITNKGEGELITSNDSVKLAYELCLLREKLPSGELELKTVYTIAEKDAVFGDISTTITGFKKGVQYLRKGDEAELVVPSSMAYMGMGTGSSYHIIPPYATLLFKIKVLDVKPKA